MRKLILLVAVFILSCGESPKEIKPEPYHNPKSGAYFGLAAFSIASENFQQWCPKFLDIQSVPKKVSTAFLWGSFGHNYSCIYQLIEQAIVLGQAIAIEIHFSCEVCRKKGVLNMFDLFPQDKTFAAINKRLEAMSDDTRKVILERVQAILDFTKPYEEIVFWILSIGLEDQFSLKAKTNLTAVIMELWPYEIAWDESDKLVPYGLFNEQHHYTKKPFGSKCILNGDGQDIDFSPVGRSGVILGGGKAADMSEVMDWAKDGIASGCQVLFWERENQGITGINESSTLERMFQIRDSTVQIFKQAYQELNKFLQDLM